MQVDENFKYTRIKRKTVLNQIKKITYNRVKLYVNNPSKIFIRMVNKNLNNFHVPRTIN